MTPQSPIVAELQTILDHLCEESVTPEQVQRLEQLVLSHPEAEAHYLRFMGFYADLIGHVAGLPEPVARGPAEPKAEPKSLPTREDRPMKLSKFPRKLWTIAASVLVAVGTVGTVAAYHYSDLAEKKREAAATQAAADASRAELARATEQQQAAQQAASKVVEEAAAKERAQAEKYRAALDAARKAAEAKEFTVRLTGPEQVEPGAPNKWQVETLRRGAVRRPKKLELVVKDASDAELFKQVDDKPVGAATLELGTAFWSQVKPGADLFLEVVAFTDDDRKNALVERLPLARPVYVTDLATDKPLYKPGETVRFRSLTLERSTLRPPATDTHLSFRLRDPSDSVVPVGSGNGRLINAFAPVLGPDQKPLRGIGVGEYKLAADAPGGEYKLDLYETVRGREVLLETRKFLVNRYVPDTFEKKLEFDGKSYGAGEWVQARVEVTRTAGGPMKDATANVAATLDGREFFTQRAAKFAIVPEGGVAKAVLNVRFQLPADIFERAKNTHPAATLSVNIQDGSDAEAIVRPVPLVTKTLNVEFFPEGGDLVAGVPGRVYFQVRTPLGKPADVKGTITDGTNTIAEVATLTDAENPGVNRGLGVFEFTPKAGTQYFLKVATPIGINPPTPSGFPLPVAKPDGVVLTALDAVTGRGGDVRVRVQVGQGTKTLHVGAYARGRLIGQQKLAAEAGNPIEVKLQGDAVAGGVTRVTVFEEVKGDDPRFARLVPRAERLVYRKPAEELILNVNPDKARYTPGGKVRLDLLAHDEKGQPKPAVLLVGVVNQSVVTMADNKTDRLMPTHFLLSGEVRHPAELEHADFLLTDHPKAAAALDLLLGTQGWRRFAEQQEAPANPLDRPDVQKLLVAHGQQPNAPLELIRLEQQRLEAEYRPTIEPLALQRAEAQQKLAATTDPAVGGPAAQVATARQSVAAAEHQLRSTSVAVSRKKADLEDGAEWLLTRGLIAGAVLAVVLLFIKGVVANSQSIGVLQTTTLAVIGVVAIIFGISSLGKNSNQTFSKVGFAVADGDRGMPARGWDNERLAAAPEPVMAPEAGAKLNKVMDRFENRPPRIVEGDWGVPPGGGANPRDLAARVPPAANVARPAVGDRNREAKEVADGRLAGPGNGVRAPGRPQRPMAPPAREPMAENAGVPNDVMLDDVHHDPVLLHAMPGVVREYAHQRDPALGDVRADFTETVYWNPVLVLPESGKASVEFQLSDDIARYRVLVAGHTIDGRVGAVTKTIEARKPFSLDPKLPLEISHTDKVDVAIRATNDTDAKRTVGYTLGTNGLKVEGTASDVFDLGPNGKGRRIVRMTADKLDGEATVLVTGASSGADNDTIARTIRIVPDGFPGVGSFSDTIEGKARGSVTLPKDLVPGTLKVRLEVYPTTMSDLVTGLDGLLREPHGCFEQTSTTNYPNAMILNYLNESNQANPQAAARAKALLATGYSRLTSFECPDTPARTRQGFEWFGAADSQHEALTAYGLLQFKDMARVHPVDPQLIKRTQDFLLSRRDGSGGFRRNARALDGFGGAPKHTTDAYIVWALVESDPDDAEKLDLKREIAALKAEALNENSTGGRDSYFVALVANVLLHRGDREAAHKLLDRLQEKHTKDGRVTGATTSITRSGGRDLDIETTGLAMLGWLRANDPKYATTVKAATKWISQQRGGRGGFGSTQSTILALKALTVYAKMMAHPAESGEFRLMVNGQLAGTRKFTPDDVNVIGLDVPNPDAVFRGGEKLEVVVETDAKQAYPFALSYTYTTLTPASDPKCAVKVGTSLVKTEANEGDTVPLWVTFENLQKQGHGMAVAVIGIPAGLKVPTDMKQLTDLREKGVVSFFEVRGRELVLYWRELAPEQKIALTVDLVCDAPGAYRGPASRGYLYYNADHKHWVPPLAVTVAPLGEVR
ncbi:a-macroglobulin complement component : TonB-dependent receptor OS=Hyalangium minutum GN=DB31_3602 PE=4 SV=1: A2M_N: A2M: Thiol-ester_cl: A2M_comp [Gemmataceae bacterium]|nr:a-macroglobulin complement component : TonB-dependent receptor OS=Hyalangium minutum GN=DB31_3602 PE=4 SV=1: A2M_N: A2M: Thiol-ester_cl: A2M_comp [Gemmataceae bacterium]VTU02728.1 a-macroglobulin complement component : TonB-dependent receptor OS=Hyalangium minutum GN=DB31_3602 PE=4 SV=1: A2M_N: A2M: Thiol-ester_cl: A2M_comp [Gemmataceae bacterium]